DPNDLRHRPLLDTIPPIVPAPADGAFWQPSFARSERAPSSRAHGRLVHLSAVAAPSVDSPATLRRRRVHRLHAVPRDKTRARGGVMRPQIGDIIVHVGEGTGVWHALFAQ